MLSVFFMLVFVAFLSVCVGSFSSGWWHRCLKSMQNVAAKAPKKKMHFDMAIDMLQLTCFRFDPVAPWSMIHLYTVHIYIYITVYIPIYHLIWTWTFPELAATHQFGYFGSLVRPHKGLIALLCRRYGCAITWPSPWIHPVKLALPEATSIKFLMPVVLR